MISEFSNATRNRRSTIIIQQSRDKTLLVRCYEDDVLIRTINVSDHSYQYAEDTAENWVQGIIP